jgi:hypothetical protein
MNNPLNGIVREEQERDEVWLKMVLLFLCGGLGMFMFLLNLII